MAIQRSDISDETILAVRSRHQSNRSAADELGVSENCIRNRLKRIDRKRREFQIEEPPVAEVPTDELLEHRKAQFRRKRQHEEASKLIEVRVKVTGPIGILHFGDPHLDDDGTDIEAVERHCDIVQATPGLFATCVGDVTNNWVGRLAKLYAEQSTSAAQAWQLAEWFIKKLSGKLLYLIGGNHDAWSGAGDPLKWITRQQSAMYRLAACRIELQLPNGQRPRINSRHDFPGHSMWNAAHGPARGLRLGVRDHIALCGDKHVSAHNVMKDPDTGRAMHAIRVATYKIFDRYAREKGYDDQNLSPCCVTVFNTMLPEEHPDYVTVFWSAEEGASYLTYLRNRHASQAHSAAEPARRRRRAD